MTEIAYDRESAVRYARRWALSRNPEYASFDKLGGDCTNFASQCVFSGSGIMNYTPDVGWFYKSILNRSAPWSGVLYLYQFLTNNQGPGPYGRNMPLFMAKPGDIIQLNIDGERFEHSTVVVSTGKQPAPDSIIVAAHSKDTDGKKLSEYEYAALRLIHIEGVRTQDN
ncbi:MAG: amidase domain-containing protein [Oscillospiraceae bacterium]|jgi:hypothetical protein|nr:amidase domain-containing protein [Oscillospiraceae bacterium]